MSKSLLQRVVILLVLLLYGCREQPSDADIPKSEPGRKLAVVFDIDGTLTPNVHTVRQVRADAATAVSILADKGYSIIYLSARIKLLAAGIPGWLKKNGFPDGTVRVAESAGDRRHPDTFKAAVLQQFSAQGWIIAYAYGDSSTDFEAYAEAGIPSEHVFALRRRGAESCQPGDWSACLSGWTEHLDFVRLSVPPAPAN